MSSIPDPATTPWVPLWDTGAGTAPQVPSIPGEVKLWGGKVLPDLTKYGKWVWADGTAYSSTTYPEASNNIAPEWKTAHGQTDPGAGMFRVPDLRGLTPCGLDQMPGGTRANRTTRSVAITVAAKTGEEYHVVTLAETPAHAHSVSDPTHGHGVSDPTHIHALTNYGFNYHGGTGAPDGYGDSPWMVSMTTDYRATGIGISGAATGISIQNAGGGGAHETMQPTVFVPYIVRLDG